MEERPRILFIDDDVTLVDMLRAYLENYGFELLAAHTGTDGIHKAQTEMPDLILLDINLPDMSGYDVAQRLHHHPRTQLIPIIFLTEIRDKPSRLHGLRLGADDYITKPFDLHELRLRIRNTLSAGKRVHQYFPTELPSPGLMAQAVEERIQADAAWALLGIFLRNFDRFRMEYGSLAANDTLQALGKLLQYVVRNQAYSEDVVGHLSAQDFVILTEPERLKTYRKAVEETLVPKLSFFYPWEDWANLPENQRLSIRMAELTEKDGVFASAEEAFSALRGRAEVP